MAAYKFLNQSEDLKSGFCQVRILQFPNVSSQTAWHFFAKICIKTAAVAPFFFFSLDSSCKIFLCLRFWLQTLQKQQQIIFNFLAMTMTTTFLLLYLLTSSVTRKKLPNVYKNCPKKISLEKWLILTPLQKLPYECGRFGQIKCCPRL